MTKPIEELHEWVYNYIDTELQADISKEDRLLDKIDSLDILTTVMEVEETFLPPSVLIGDKEVQSWLADKEVTVEEFLDKIVASVKKLLDEE